MDLAKEILADPAIRDTKLILLTAFDAPGLGLQAVSLGFVAYLTKPVRQTQMLQCLSKVLSGDSHLSARSAADGRIARGEAHLPRKELILVAEDYVINQQVAQLYLDELGFASHIVSNGIQSVEAVLSNSYSLVLMDCQMPEMDGFTATQLIRKEEETSGKRIPIIAVTAHAMHGDRERCLEAGMDDYISKPIAPEALRILIEKWLPDSNIAARSNQPIDFLLAESKYGQSANQLFEMFLDAAPLELAHFKQAMIMQDTNAMNDLAHGFKGISSTICAIELKGTCTEIEKAVQDREWDHVHHLIERLETEIQQVQKLILIKRGNGHSADS